MDLFFKIETFKSFKKEMESFFNIKNFNSHKKDMQPFFSIKNFKSHKSVMEFFLVFSSFKNRKKVAEFFFSGHASLSFHMMHKFPGTIFSLSVPNEFLWLYIFISMKKDVEHMSLNTVRATFLLHK